jgi:hypothetical protein
MIDRRTIKRRTSSSVTRCWFTCICLRPSDVVSSKRKMFLRTLWKILTQCLDVWQILESWHACKEGRKGCWLCIYVLTRGVLCGTRILSCLGLCTDLTVFSAEHVTFWCALEVSGVGLTTHENFKSIHRTCMGVAPEATPECSTREHPKWGLVS